MRQSSSSSSRLRAGHVLPFLALSSAIGLYCGVEQRPQQPPFDETGSRRQAVETTLMDCNISSLISAIDSTNAAGGGTITLKQDCVYKATNIHNYWYGTNCLPAITSDVTIVGNGKSIIERNSGAAPFRLFYVAGKPTTDAGLSGLGAAAFHPQASAMVSAAGGEKKGLYQAVFGACGNLGWALTPLFVIPLVERYGLSVTPYFVAPGIIVTALLAVKAQKTSPREQGQAVPLLEACGVSGATARFAEHFSAAAKQAALEAVRMMAP